MSALHDRTTRAEVPAMTADNPHVGSIGWGDIVLSRVAYWREDGDHVFRSLEYDVIAADSDPYRAVHGFVQNSVEYARLLSSADERTPEDVELANTIMGRLVAILEAIQLGDERERPILRRLRHGRRRRGNHWGLRPVVQS